MVATRVISRKGNSADVPALQPAEFGYDLDTKTARVGDDTSTPPKILTSKTTGTFDLTSLDELLLPQGTLDNLEELLIGDKGWTPVLTGEELHGRALLKITDYVGGEGTKPTDFIGYYISIDGNPTDDHNLALNIRGRTGAAGAPPLVTLSINDNGELLIHSTHEELVVDGSEINEAGELIIAYTGGTDPVLANLGRVVVFHRGIFDIDEQYYPLDEVFYLGATYRVKWNVEVEIGSLPTDTDFWIKVGEFDGKGGISDNRPSDPYDFEMYFDITLGHPIWYSGTNWVDATGTIV